MDLCNIQDIRALLGRHGFHFSKSMGQNFLTAAWVPEQIVEQSCLDGGHGVLEIGPGIGCLTVQLARTAGKVVSVELDRALLPVLEETLAGLENTQVISGDILKTDVGALVDEHLAGYTPAVCANLPYNITTPVLTRLIDSGRFSQITVMIQREVARRICAGAGTSDYGAFSVYINYHTEPQLLFDVSPGCFIPQPKVHSSVITLKTRNTPPVTAEKTALFRVVKAAFSQRRKTLVNCLNSALPQASKAELEAVLTGLGYDGRIRGETLDLQGFSRVTEALLSAGLMGG